MRRGGSIHLSQPLPLKVDLVTFVHPTYLCSNCLRACISFTFVWGKRGGGGKHNEMEFAILSFSYLMSNICSLVETFSICTYHD